MIGLFSRPSRRSRNVRRSSTGPVLRVEALETRANPAGPVLSNLAATWSNPTHVVVTGQVVDQFPTAVWVNGGGQGAAFVSNQGAFRIALTTNGIDPIHVQAEDTQTQFSANMLCTYGASSPVAVTGGSPVVSGVTITLIEGTWHIHGQLSGGTGLDTIIRIIGSTGGVSGEQIVINDDGTFDIGITVGSGGFGGDISIVAVNPVTGGTSEVLWEGTID